MTRQEIERAWEDRLFRLSLSDAERAGLPENPAGPVELPEGVLGDVAGGTTTEACGGTIVLSAEASCAPNCDTLFRGTCGAFSIGCCPTPE